MDTGKQESLWRRLPALLTTPVAELFGKAPGGAKEVRIVNVTDKKAMTLEGLIDRGKETHYSVNGVDFAVKEETWIFGELEYGSRAKVFYALVNGKGRVAQKIVIMAPPPKNS